MQMQKKTLIKCIVLPLAVGALSGFLCRNGMKAFMSMPQPPLSPPSWLFPIVWTILYVLMGIASYYILASESKERGRALALYGIQLAFNFFWSIIFFNVKNYLFAFGWLMAMWLLIIMTAVSFYMIKKKAGCLLIPYIAWTTFAAYLNYGVYLLQN